MYEQFFHLTKTYADNMLGQFAIMQQFNLLATAHADGMPRSVSKGLMKNLNTYSEERLNQLEQDLNNPDSRFRIALEEIAAAVETARFTRKKILIGTVIAGAVVIPPTAIFLYWYLLFYITNNIAP